MAARASLELKDGDSATDLAFPPSASICLPGYRWHSCRARGVGLWTVRPESEWGNADFDYVDAGMRFPAPAGMAFCDMGQSFDMIGGGTWMPLSPGAGGFRAGDLAN